MVSYIEVAFLGMSSDLERRRAKMSQAFMIFFGITMNEALGVASAV